MQLIAMRHADHPALEEDLQPVTAEWLESLDYVLNRHGTGGALELLEVLRNHLHRRGVAHPSVVNMPYANTIPLEAQPPYPGCRDLEQQIEGLIRWNAAALMAQIGRPGSTIHPDLSACASAVTLYEVGLNHLFRGREGEQCGDQVYFQTDASPYNHARAFLEGRISERQMEDLRRELHSGGTPARPSLPLVPDGWEAAVPRGQAPLLAIHQARLNRYLDRRRLKATRHAHVWCFLADSECDDPGCLGSLMLAARERLDNLTFVVNCNLEPSDGLFGDDGTIIQKLEALFCGAGWNVIKVIWGGDWDPLLVDDRPLRPGPAGDRDSYRLADMDHRPLGTPPGLEAMARLLSHERIRGMVRGGHDPEKIYAAYKAALEHDGSPTVILARSIRGYGLEDASNRNGQSTHANGTHAGGVAVKPLDLLRLRDRLGIPLSRADAGAARFYRPPNDSPALAYLDGRRRRLGGAMPRRAARHGPPLPPTAAWSQPFTQGSGEREQSTAAAFAALLSRLLRDPDLGRLAIPILPRETGVFAPEPLICAGAISGTGEYGTSNGNGRALKDRFPAGIHMPPGEVDRLDEQTLAAGGSVSGGMAAFIAAGRVHATHGVNAIPFFVHTTSEGVSDLVRTAIEAGCRGFLISMPLGTHTSAVHRAGRALPVTGEEGGESLPCDGPLSGQASTVREYAPAFAYELELIVQDGIHRMYGLGENTLYHLILCEQAYPMPPGPEHATEGILRGLYCCRRSPLPQESRRVHLFGSGAALPECLRAAALLADRFRLAADVWSVTSYTQLFQDCLETQHWNTLHPCEPPRMSFLSRALQGEAGPVVAVTQQPDVMPARLAAWLPDGLIPLGPGRLSGSRCSGAHERWQVRAEQIAVAAMYALSCRGRISARQVQQAVTELDVEDAPHGGGSMWIGT